MIIPWLPTIWCATVDVVFPHHGGMAYHRRVDAYILCNQRRRRKRSRSWSLIKNLCISFVSNAIENTYSGFHKWIQNAHFLTNDQFLETWNRFKLGSGSRYPTLLPTFLIMLEYAGVHMLGTHKHESEEDTTHSLRGEPADACLTSRGCWSLSGNNAKFHSFRVQHWLCQDAV